MNLQLNSESSILITGGTGSFGKALTEYILRVEPNVRRLVIFSRDEMKQSEMQKHINLDRYPGVRYFLGDIRDKDRLQIALSGIDFVIHAAALKQVPAAEYNPFEFIKTNIIGAQNLIEASIQNNVKKVIALSTDKAAAPINLYGATKLCSDKLFVAANNIVGSRDTYFSVVRYGNVMGSRGSVIPYFLEIDPKIPLPITDSNMTRFNITLTESVEMVLWVIKNSIGGEIFVPKIPSYRLIDLAQAIRPEGKYQIVGVRPGEKIHEEMITSNDSFSTFDLGDYYVILSPSHPKVKQYYEKSHNAKPVEPGFSYNSGFNENFLSVDQIKSLIQKNIDPSLK